MSVRLMGRVITLFVLLCAIPGADAAASWSRTYGGAGTEQARDIRQTADGGYIVAGETTSFGAGGVDLWLIKLDGGGNVQWEKTHGGMFTERARAVQQTSDGGYITAGETNSFGAGGNDMWVIKLDASGNVQWQQTYGSPSGNEIAYSVREKPGGGYVISGRTDALMAATQPPDALVLDVDSSGTVQWQSVYGGMTDMQNEAFAAALTDDNADGVADDGIIFVGVRMAMLATDFDFWVVKLDSAGTVQWERFFDSGLPLINGDIANSVEQTADGGFIVAGEAPSNNSDFWIIKLDSMGNVQWQTSHGSASGDSALDVVQTTDGGYIGAGFTTVNGNDAFLVKLDSTGTIQWQKAYGGSVTDQAAAIQQTVDGGFVVAGFADSFGTGGRELWVFKTDPNGDLDTACNLTTTTGFMLTATSLGQGMATALFSPASAVSGGTTATVATSSLARVTQCAGLSPSNTRVNQAINGDHEQECAITIDPSNSNNRAIIYMDDPAVLTTVRFPSLGVSFTNDAGVSWNDRQIQFTCDGIDNDLDGLTDEEFACDGQDDDLDGLIDEDLCCNLLHIDPSIAADATGNLFAAFIAHEPAASTSFSGSAYVTGARSTDWGNSWTVFPPIDQSVFTPGFPTVDFLDKCWLAVDNDATSAFNGTAYVAWQRDDVVSATLSNVFVSSLAPGSPFFSTPVRVNDVAQQCADAPYPVQGVGGDLWVIWRHNNNVCGGQGQFWLDKSTTGGLTWLTPGDIPGPTYTPIPPSLYTHGYRTSDFPVMVVDPTNPNALYVVYSENPGGTDEANVVFQRSLNGGLTWLQPVPVTINTDATIEPQYFPVIRAKQNSAGRTMVDVVWVDERNNVGCRIDDDGDGLVDEDPADGIDNDLDGLFDEDRCDIRMDIYFARSVNPQAANPTFGPNIRVTSQSFPAPRVPPQFLGDYIDLVPLGASDLAVWTDTRSGDNDIYFDQIGDVDSDGDSVLDFSDCNPSDALVFGIPGVVQSVAVGTGSAVSWTSQDPATGSGTVYDVVSGLASQLAQDGNYTRATCLVNNHGNTPYTDTRSAPPTGDAYYYLVRAHSSCAVGSFGATGPSDPRSALDSTTPCPF